MSSTYVFTVFKWNVKAQETESRISLLRYLCLHGESHLKVQERLFVRSLHVTYVKRSREWFNGWRARATGKVVRCSKSERTENTTVIKEPEVRSLPGTFLFILQNKVNETICKKVKGGVLLEYIKYTFLLEYIKYTGGT